MAFIGPHHAYRRNKKQTYAKKHTWFKKLLDKSFFLVALIAVSANFPQLFTIWVLHKTDGVSLLSWVGFLLGSLFWLAYGLFHKEKLIILINSMLLIVQGIIILGIIIQPK